MSELADAELWAGARGGDEGAFGVLFDRHHRAVYNYCFRRTADWAAAEDLTSVIFLETWRRRAAVRLEHASLLPWLYGVATNVLRNHQRSLRRHRDALDRLPHVPAEDDTEAVAGRVDDQRRMRALLARIDALPRRYQDVLTLCVWEELSYEQVFFRPSPAKPSASSAPIPAAKDGEILYTNAYLDFAVVDAPGRRP